MKKLILMIYILSINIILNCQERKDREKLYFLNESDIIYNAVGWSYNDVEGEWVDYRNFIEYNKSYKTKFKSLLHGYAQSSRKQNFLSLQFKTLIYESDTFYVLLVNKWDGRFKYPSIREDWEYWKEVEAYIFHKRSYSNLLEGKEVIELKTQRKSSMGSLYEKYSEEKMLDLIQSELLKEKSMYSLIYTFPIKIITVEEKELVRFYIPQRFTEFDNYDFDKRYFEIGKQEFMKLVID